MQYVVMSGSPFDGMIVNGPFATADDACKWAEGLTTDWWVDELEPVEPACDCLCHGPNAGLRGHHHTGCKCREDVNLRLGKALDDLGDANQNISGMRGIISTLNDDLDACHIRITVLEKALQAAQAHDDQVHERLNRAMDALDAISNRVHAAIGGCNLSE
jgi:hypothetical protein